MKEKEKFVYNCIAKHQKMRGTFTEKKIECEEEWAIRKV